jgi:hypothetical protein
MYGNLAIIAVFVFLYSVASGRLERTSFGGTILFTAFCLVEGPFAVHSWLFSVDIYLR